MGEGGGGGDSKWRLENLVDKVENGEPDEWMKLSEVDLQHNTCKSTLHAHLPL